MGSRGPRPQPKALALLKGTYRPDRGAANPAMPVAELPSCPPHLDEEAKKEWRRVSRLLLNLGLLTKIDRAALAAYCVCWSRWVEAEGQLKEQGLMVKSPNGFDQVNPYLSVANKALEQMRGFASEFGLTPATRSRVEALPVPRASEDAKKKRKQLLFGDGDSKLSKYISPIKQDMTEEEREHYFFGDSA
jgi:P27 family predicted phage terminase small subunit